MIDVREAVQIAQSYLLQLFPTEADNVRLEEVELNRTENRAEWHVTLSFIRRGDVVSAGGVFDQLVGGAASRRHFKTFVIDALDREVRAMRIRQIPA